MKKKWFKIIKKNIRYFFILSLLAIVIANLVVINNAKEKIFSSTKLIPKNEVGLLLGTSKTLINGQQNFYFTYRVNAAVELFKAGKIKFILISGDNRTKNNNEPKDFKDELLKRGIPENKIYLDYAGFRTLDSVVRLKEIFGQNSVTMISQEFHNERAIYLAEHFGINAIGYNAKDVTNSFGFKTQVREYFARVKVFVDIIFNVEPKFLGKKIEIK
ncbi:ElyC/SanA/YdcF family protein [uncultured Polaribacter sp.]|uniref:SanA/YdcF family protein n=1 Tax=uncultured Polaribacter sp. TaxID=174711 RepID=UPI002605776D|nr:ElyC/SanA/YdcF family protein [uncultured Polaribacter sp.]